MRAGGQWRLVASGGFAWFGFESRRSARDQLEPEHASSADGTFDPQFAPHEPNQSFGSPRADTCTCHTTHGLLSKAIEWLVEHSKLLWRQTCPCVSHADTRAFRGSRPARHDHRPQHTVVFNRVGEQVNDDLLEPRPIGADEDRMVEAGKGHAEPALLRLGLKHGLAFGYDLGQGYWLRREHHLAGLDHRQIKDLVDQFQQMPSRLEDLSKAFLLRVRRRWRGRL